MATAAEIGETNATSQTIQVAVRIRPLVQSEIVNGCASVVYKQAVGGQDQIVFPGEKRPYAFNYVFEQKESQKVIYDKAVAPLTDHLFRGYNATILAYGQTGSGKTFTMGTVVTGDETMETSGIIPRAVDDIFQKIQSWENYEVSTSCSFFEVYNEQIFDLLTGRPREESTRELCMGKVADLTEKSASSAEECLDLLIQGSKLRSVGATKMNKESSRSHAIFAINLKCRPLSGDDESELQSKLLLVDLAGSERCKKTAAQGDRFKEGVNINMGLFVLGNVINALCDKHKHVPYRNSKLTQVLEDSLGGNSYTLMIACVSPADFNTEETTNTLRYANRAKNIKNKPVQNVDSVAAELKRLRDENQKLQLALLEKNPSGVIANSTEIHNLKALNEQLVMENKILLSEKSQLMVENTNLDCRATMMEELYEDIQHQLVDLKGNLCVKTENDSETASEDVKKVFNDIDERMARFKTDRSSSVIENMNEEQVAMQSELQEKIRNINKEMQIKEQLLHRMQTNQNCTVFALNQTFDVTNYGETIEALQKELEELRQKEKFKDKKDTNTQKLSEDRRKRIQDLEMKISELQKRCIQQEKMLKIRQRDSERVKTLGQEITAMRQEKVRIIRQMKQENDQFRNYRIAREKEMNKLKEQDKKRQNELIRKEAMHQKQQQVMRRKMDEAMAQIKRFKDASNKSVAIRKQKDAKTADTISLLQHDLEIIHSVIDARITIRQLCDDRAVLNIRMTELKQQDDVENALEIASLEQEIKARSAQIADFQQHINTTNIDVKMKELHERLQSISDLKSAFKFLIKDSMEVRENIAKVTLEMNDLKTHNEVLEEEKSTALKEITQLRNTFSMKESELQRNHEEKIIVLLHEIDLLRKRSNHLESSDLSETSQFTTQMSTLVQELHEELEAHRERIQELEDVLQSTEKQNPRKRARKPITNTTFNANESILELESSESDEDDESDSCNDPEWKLTPLAKRVRKSRSLLRQTFAVPAVPAKKLSSSSGKCACKGTCANKLCSCKKRDDQCSDQCKCDKLRCTNTVVTIPETPEKDRPESIELAVNNDSQNTDPNSTFAIFKQVTPRKSRLEDMDLTPSYIYSKKKRPIFFDKM